MNYSKGPEIKIFCKRVCTCTQSTQRTQCTQCTFVYKHILVFWHEDLHRGLAHVCCKELPPGIRGRFTEIFVDEADSSRTCPTDSFFGAFLFRLVLLSCQIAHKWPQTWSEGFDRFTLQPLWLLVSSLLTHYFSSRPVPCTQHTECFQRNFGWIPQVSECPHFVSTFLTEV